MARTSIIGQSKAVAASASAIDTLGYGTVSIVIVGGSAETTGTITVGDKSNALAAPPASDVLGENVAAIGEIELCSYVGPARYVKVAMSGTGGTGLVFLSEKRMA